MKYEIDTGYQKQVGWINSGDGFLVLDRDFNQSVDNGTELLSNPLVADAAKGLRSLAAWDANGDGKITAADPIFNQLKVWQDFNQDGNNTSTLSVNTASGVQSYQVQDEANGVKELRSLAELGITAIDYGNGRYEMSSSSGNNDGGYREISTVNLEAEQDGVRYTPVGAGIKIETTDGPPLDFSGLRKQEVHYAVLSQRKKRCYAFDSCLRSAYKGGRSKTFIYQPAELKSEANVK